MDNPSKSFELGPIQKLWVETLRKYSERQHKGSLGYFTKKENWQLCCLGQAVCNLHPELVKHIELMVNDTNLGKGSLYSDKEYNILSEEDKSLLGLKTSNGSFGKHIRLGDIMSNAEYPDFVVNSLVELNDLGISWTIIADVIEKYAEDLFTEPK